MGCLSDPELYAFVQGGLTEQPLVDVDAHLDACAACRRLVVELARSSTSNPTPDFDPEALPRGAMVGRYLVLGVLGGGAMGVVYAAHDPELDRKVALKLIYGTEDEGGDRLLREAQAMARLSHPNVVGVYGLEHARYGDFLAMEYVAGTTLREWLHSKARSVRDIVSAFVDSGRGLAAAHAVGVIHRDFKPDNVLIDESGRVLVTDFGLARRIAEAQPGPARAGIAANAVFSIGVTRTGAILGTPAYMAPEQHTGREIDERTDQFSYCVALYEALYDQRPFSGRSVDELKAAVLAGRIEPPPSGGRISMRLRRVLTTGLASRGEDRFSSMNELLTALASSTSRSRMWLLSAPIVAMVIAVLAIARFTALPSTFCTGAENEFAEIWNPRRAKGVEQAFSALGEPASDVWKRTGPLLDRYGREWIAMHRDTCEATRVRGEQSEDSLDVRMACLDQRLKEIDSLATILADADTDVANRALMAVYSVTPVSVCADAQALRDRGLLPDEPGLRARVIKFRYSLARAKTLRDIGRYPQGLKLLQQIRKEHAPALEYLPAAADLHLILGQLHKKMGDFQTAEVDLTEAVWAGEAGGNGEAVFAAAASLVGVARRQDKLDQALHWSRHADAVLRHIGDDAALRAELHIVVGNLYWARDDLSHAETEYRQALKLYERTLGEHPDTAFAYHNLALIFAARGQLDDAMKYDVRALDLRRLLLGPRHPDVAESLGSLGNVHSRKGEYTEATKNYREALTIAEEVLGPDSPAVAAFLNNLGTALSKQGEYDAAVAQVTRAAVITEKRFGPNHSDLGYSFETFGDLALLRERPEEALGHFQRALEIWELSLGKDHSQVASPLTGIGEAYVKLAQPLQAVAWLERALSIRERRAGSASDLARTRFVLARALWDSRRGRKRALALAMQAREALAATKGHGSELEQVAIWLAAHQRILESREE